MGFAPPTEMFGISSRKSLNRIFQITQVERLLFSYGGVLQLEIYDFL